MAKIKWGIIAPGKIAKRIAEDIPLSANAELYAVASRSEKRARSFAEKYNAAKYYGSYQELAEDKDIDIVYVASPHAFHFEHSMLCLKHGKAVLCEKPMGMNAEEEKILINTAQEKGLFLMEGMWTRFIPATQKLLEVLHDNMIGKIAFMQADFGFKATYDPQGRLFNKQLGGGALLDIGIYPVYLAYLCLGMPADVKAMARMTETGVDSYCTVLLDFENKAKAVLESNFEAVTPTEARIYGSEGSIILHNRFHHARKITVSTNGKQIDYELPYRGNGYVHEIDEVNYCLQNGLLESPKHPLQMSLDLAMILDRIRSEIGLEY